jgi:hypothetical protein
VGPVTPLASHRERGTDAGGHTSPSVSPMAMRAALVCSGHRAAPTGARTWMGGSPPACMAHGGATSQQPHLSGARHGGPRSAGALASSGEADAREKREGRRGEQPTRAEPSSGKRR